MSASDRAGLGTYLGSLSNELAGAGASFAAITAVAPYMAIKEISRISRIPVVNVLDTLAGGLHTAGVDRVATMYTDIALNGKRGTRVETERLGELAQELIEKHGAKAIVLAGTDLSSFYADHKPDYPFLDMAQLHIDQIVNLATA